MSLLNPVLACLNIKPTDRIITVKENGNIDSNFIITHLIKQIFQDNENKLCLVILHNTIGHYHNVGKRLGYDLQKQLNNGSLKTIEPLIDLVEEIGTTSSSNYLINSNKLEIVQNLFRNIKTTIDELISTIPATKKVYLIIDDISHLLDLGIDLKYIINFINYCLNLVNNEQICVIISAHVCGKCDEIISNNLNYVSDVNIEVLPLKTGLSKEVTGVISIERMNPLNVARYHFKAFDKGIKTFHLGESIYNLYK